MRLDRVDLITVFVDLIVFPARYEVLNEFTDKPKRRGATGVRAKYARRVECNHNNTKGGIAEVINYTPPLYTPRRWALYRHCPVGYNIESEPTIWGPFTQDHSLAKSGHQMRSPLSCC